MTENKGDIISREALKETIDEITWYHINPYGELVEGAHGDSDAFYKAEDIYNAIDNASTVENITIFCENADEKTIEELKAEMQKAKLAVFEEIPQGDIRWTDKVFVTSSGDIIDFEGRVVGHINLEYIKGDVE